MSNSEIRTTLLHICEIPMSIMFRSSNSMRVFACYIIGISHMQRAQCRFQSLTLKVMDYVYRVYIFSTEIVLASTFLLLVILVFFG